MVTLEVTHRSKVDEVIEALEAIDLTKIKEKMMDITHGKGWSEKLANEVEIEYRRFLALSIAYPEETIVPSKIVDDFWHAHILDTRAYARDCEIAVGYFFHHWPYLGIGGPAEQAKLWKASDSTRELYTRHFGPPSLSYWSAGQSVIESETSAATCSTPSECYGTSPGGCTSRCSSSCSGGGDDD